MSQPHHLTGNRPIPPTVSRLGVVLAGGLWLLAALWLGPTLRADSPPSQTTPTRPERLSYDSSRVGDDAGGRIVVPTNQVLSPLGRQVTFRGRPTDVALSPSGRWLAVLNRDEVLILDPEQGDVVDRKPLPGGSYKGIVFTPDGHHLLASSVASRIGVFAVGDGGLLKEAPPILLPAARADNALPVGMTITSSAAEETTPSLWVALNLNNTLAEIDLARGALRREIAVGSAPYDVVVVGTKAYVSNWAGRHPGPGDPIEPSGEGTPVRVNPRTHVASDGSVSVVDLKLGKETGQIVVGLHPSGLAATRDGRYVCVANANSDTVSVIDTQRDTVVETISTRPDEKLLFGSTPNALALSGDGHTLYVANGTNNSVAVIDFQPPHSRLAGCLPTGWYPAGLVLDEARGALYVANVKGVGSRNLDWKGQRTIRGKTVFGYNSHDYLGSVSLMDLPSRDELASATRAVLENNRLTESISVLAPPRENIAPRAVPSRHGEPSHFKHVLYIIKENRTYDQVLGDIERGEGDPTLCIFGREVTPNHHKLVDQFVLLDNFYCSGTLSADGHQWTNEAYVTDYLEKAYGGWPRSYPYEGGDAMAYAPSGFIWDNVLAHQRTLRVYGEFVHATIRWKDSSEAPSQTNEAHSENLTQRPQISAVKKSNEADLPTDGASSQNLAQSQQVSAVKEPSKAASQTKAARSQNSTQSQQVSAVKKKKQGKRPSFLDCYRDFLADSQRIEVKATAAIETLTPYLCPTAIGFPSIVPDVHRAEQFVRELKQYEQAGDFPNFMIMLLPNDHTAGTRPGMPTPAAAVADNDLALGRVVDAVSHSKFWSETCIFVVQDDPQAGFDHIDGHRTVAMVISPYTRRGAIDSTNYNQTSMMRTMELILGLPPMNQFDASATPMTACFTDQADLTPYQAVPNIVPLDQMNPDVESIADPRQRHWALASLEMPLDEVDEADEDTLNRVLWHARRGRDATYPAWAVPGRETDD
ncbi:MAG: alkaline phosphatase family protein [Pirellulales bacterium]